MRSSKLVLVVVALAVCGCGLNAAITEPAAAAPSADTGVRRVETSAATSPVDVARPPAAGAGMAALDALPWAERVSLERALAADSPRFAPRMGEHGPVLETPGSITATFTSSGAQLAISEHTTTLQIAALGRGRSVRTLAAGVRVDIAGPEVRTSRGAGVVEWWRSLPSGLEHGVTIAGRPAGDGELRVEVAVSGELAAKFVSDDSVELRDAGGARVATYAHLVVLDAAGARVPAHMAVDDGHIVLAVDDADARYPLVIDPLVTAEEAMLRALDDARDDAFGFSAALTSDGSRALVGAYLDDTVGGLNAGSARVFVRAGTGWVEEAILLAADGAANDQFGYSVALTSDGSRAFVGVCLDDTAGGINAGSARVFLRTGTTWAQEATLVAPDGAADDQFGFSVALTSDGSRALVGAYLDDTVGGGNAGSARTFLRTGTSWAPEATLVAPDGAANDQFGSAVALTSDGSRALVGARFDSGAGSARVFLLTGTTWAQEATLFIPGGAVNDFFGSSVALASDGSRALVGAYRDDTVGGVDAGSVRVFLRTGATWAQEATLLAPDGAPGDYFGFSVAISSDGSRALAGAYADDTAGGIDAGSARVFLRTGTSWTAEATLLAPDGLVFDNFGSAVALASDGSRALVGAVLDDTAGGPDAGSAHVFLRTGTNWAHEATVAALGGATGDGFGCSVALSSDGSRALVGVLSDDTLGGVNAGSARVFLRSGMSWAQEAILLAPDGLSNDQFGYSVALSSDGSRALVGARLDETPGGLQAGSARVFLRTGIGWAPEATLLAPDAAACDHFGNSVALSSDGSRAFVGASQDDTAAGADAGSAHVFLRTGTTWTEEAALLAPDGAADDRFGQSVAVSSDGSRLFVGALRGDTASGPNAGSVRVFLRTGTGWAQEATLFALDGMTDDYLGQSVAVSSDGSRALVGAPGDDTAGGTDAGSARVFLRTGTSWTEEATLLAPDGAATDYLGGAVALSSEGSRALLGAWSDDTPGGIDAGSARVFVRIGTTWAYEAMLLISDGMAGDNLGESVAFSSDGSRGLVGAWQDDTPGGINAGSARVFTLLGTNGSVCNGDPACVSGFCSDGVCCSTRCAGGATACQACSAALTGGTDGTCALLSATAAPTVVCRASADLCDVAETCTSTSTVCPTNTFATPSTVCRAAATGCDVADTCTGTSAACPADSVATAGVVCRAASAVCQLDALCTGGSTTCPVNAPAPDGTTCRPSVGICDTAELCDGSSFACPGDVLLPAGSPCGPALGLCDLAEVCTGTSPACPADVLRAPGLVCRPPVPGGCDVAETCTGVLPTCPDDLFAASSTLCGPAVSGVCDAADHCSGTSADCVETYLSAVECRASNGPCDTPEVCLGDAPSCPLDAVASAGVACRISVDPSCDPEEACDGVDTSCPVDVITCIADAGASDAGPAEDGSVARDAGDALDATVAVDAGALPVASPGCGCRVAHGRDSRTTLFAALFALALLGVRRRRGRCARSSRI